MAALDLHFKDIYGNMGIDETSTIVQPDSDDQNALVDNQEIAEKINTNSTPNKHKILGAVGIIIGITVLTAFLSK